ncbi:hypothetical protein [Arthrobacter sp. MMS24-S77]
MGIEGVHPADMATAEHLGRRVADIASIFAAGRIAKDRELVSTGA